MNGQFETINKKPAKPPMNPAGPPVGQSENHLEKHTLSDSKRLAIVEEHRDKLYNLVREIAEYEKYHGTTLHSELNLYIKRAKSLVEVSK
jgi:hypothetical protein